MAIKHTIRDAKGHFIEKKLTTRSAIKEFCNECMCFFREQVKNCTAVNCPLFPFRLGDSHTLDEHGRVAASDRAKIRGFGKKKSGV